MKGHSILAVWSLVLILTMPSLFASRPLPTSAPAEDILTPPSASARTVFVENVGQIADPGILFSLSTGAIRFSEDSILVRVSSQAETASVVRISFEGAHPTAVQGLELAVQRNHYMIGNNPSEWQSDVRTFHGLEYRGLYPGIDLRYRASGDGVKYELELAAGADPSRIRLLYEGIEGLAITAGGDLDVRTAGGDLRDTAPVAIQDGTYIACRFAIVGPASVGFACEGQNRSRPFTIDPLLFATYLGGSDQETARAVAVDGSGNVYTAGETYSFDFPVTPGAYNRTRQTPTDAFIAKFDPSGRTLLYATFLGGSGSDAAYALAVDAAGDAFVGGLTFSSNFPTTPGAFRRAFAGAESGFVTKLDANGAALVYSTFVGGSVADAVFGLTVDGAGNAFVTGPTGSTDFPVTPGAYQTTYGGSLQDGFAAEVNPLGSALVFATFLGGVQIDEGTAIAVDGAGNVYVTGNTLSMNFPTTVGAFDTVLSGSSDAFLSKLSADGTTLAYSTFLGGGGSDSGAAVAVDRNGSAFVLGATASINFPATPGAFDTTCGTDGNCDFDGSQPYYDTYVAKVNASGANLDYATYLGGASHDDPGGIAVDANDRATVAGYTRSTDFPATPGADNTTFLGGLSDGFVTRLNATGSGLVYSTFLGGAATDEIHGLALDSAGIAAVGGSTNSTDFRATPGAFQTTFAGAVDAFVARLALAFPLSLATIPSGLQILVDGAPGTAPYPYFCEPGSTHILQAPTPQIAGSTRYALRSWSDGGLATHAVTCTAPDTLTATYDITDYEISVATVPSGLQVQVDGVPHPATYSFWCSVASSHTLFAPSPQTAGPTQYTFLSWSDAGAQLHSIACNAALTYAANFATQYQVTVTATPAACQVLVDGVSFAPPATFWWADGSTHVISVPSPQGGPSTRYVFSSWSDSGAQTHSVVASGPATYTATCLTQNNVTVLTTPLGFMLLVNGTSVSSPFSFWCDSNSNATLDVPSPQGAGPTRYVFATWSDAGPKLHVISCSTSATYTATFTVEHLTNLDTVPTGLVITLDGINRTAAYSFWCPEGTTHQLDAPSPQGAGPTRRTFLAWADGGPRLRTIACTQPSNYSASFATEYLITTATSPPNLLVTVDGVTTNAPVSNWWADGSTHAIAAPSPQGSGGTRSSFFTWSDGGAQAHNVTATAGATITATFLLEHQVTFDSAPAGLKVLVSGTEYVTPVTLWLTSGSAWTLDATNVQNGSAGVRYVWSSWSDGGGPSHSITISGPTTLTAAFSTEYFLALRSPRGNPWCDGNLTATGCWYSANISAGFSVNSTVPAAVGVQYVFLRWVGDLNSANPNGYGYIAKMDGPKTESAEWGTQYYLQVITSLGVAIGEGWYDAGSRAPFRVNATEVTGTDGVRYRFSGWSGNYTGAAADGTVLMDGAKTVIAHWAPIPFFESAWWLFLLPAVAAILILIFLAWRRRKKGRKEAALRAEEESAETQQAGSLELDDELDLHTSA